MEDPVIIQRTLLQYLPYPAHITLSEVSRLYYLIVRELHSSLDFWIGYFSVHLPGVTIPPQLEPITAELLANIASTPSTNITCFTPEGFQEVLGILGAGVLDIVNASSLEEAHQSIFTEILIGAIKAGYDDTQLREVCRLWYPDQGTIDAIIPLLVKSLEPSYFTFLRDFLGIEEENVVSQLNPDKFPLYLAYYPQLVRYLPSVIGRVTTTEALEFLTPYVVEAIHHEYIDVLLSFILSKNRDEPTTYHYLVQWGALRPLGRAVDLFDEFLYIITHPTQDTEELTMRDPLAWEVAYRLARQLVFHKIPADTAADIEDSYKILRRQPYARIPTGGKPFIDYMEAHLLAR